MRMQRWLAIAVVLCSATVWGAGWQGLGAISNVQQVPSGVEVRAGTGAIRITALSPSVIRVRYAPNGTFPADHSWAVVERTGFTAPQPQVQDTNDAVEVSTGETRVRIEKA